MKATDVQFYSHHARELKHTQQNKVLKFIEHKCIDYEGHGVFICKPIPNYNKRTYEIQKDESGEFCCNCQYYVMGKKKGEKRFCSHIGALFEYFARGRTYGV